MSKLITRLNNIRSFATKSLLGSKQRSKEYYDRRSRTHEYSSGHWVYILKEARANKLDKAYIGPYKIIDILEKRNVILENDKNKRILKHIDKIKPAYLHDPDNDKSSTK